MGSLTKVLLILQLLKLDEEIKDFILRLDDSDPGLSTVAAYRLQPLLQVKSKERQRRKFWEMIEEQLLHNKTFTRKWQGPGRIGSQPAVLCRNIQRQEWSNKPQPTLFKKE